MVANNQFFIGEIVSLIIITIFGILLSVFLKLPLLFGFMPGVVFLVVLCRRKGTSWGDLVKTGVHGALKTREVVIILLLVSMLLPAWGMSGTISHMVAVALRFLTVDHFVVLSFTITLVFSMLLGTAVGSLSAIGIPIMSAASSIGLPQEIVAGALVSGAFVGDRTSPFSSANQLLAATVEVPVFSQFKKLLLTTLVGLLGCLVFYFVMDFNLDRKATITGDNSIPLHNAEQYSFINLVPALLLLLLACFRWKIKYAFICSIIAAILIAVINGNEPTAIAEQLWNGSSQLGGGIKHMLLLVLFIAVAGVYNGLIEEFHVIQPILDRWLNTSNSLTGSTVKTMVASFIISIIACNQTLPIILTGRSFLSYWQQRHSKVELSRIVADSSMLFPGMIPWSILTIMCSTIVGVPVVNYLPYAVFIWLLPIVTIIISYVRQTFSKQKQEVAGSCVS